MPRVIVTGANRGLGRAVAQSLAKRGHTVTGTTRTQLDLADPGSIAAFTATVPGPIDLLVNNAGVALDGFDAAVAEQTIAVNFYGPLRLTEALRAKLATGARVVMVSSGLGALAGLDRRLDARFTDPSLDAAALCALTDEFVDAVRRGTWQRDGWPGSAYRVSKIALNALTRVYAREGLDAHAVCPGWVRTDMGGPHAERSVEAGAASILAACDLPPGTTPGRFWRDGRAIEW